MADELYLGNLNNVASYEVRLDFTDRMEPSLLSKHGLPYVSMQDEILANTRGSEGEILRKQYKRVLYGSPIYFWESQTGEDSKILYVGQTMRQTLQKRFEGHSAVMKLLAHYVNCVETKVYFRLCSRLDLTYEERGHTVVRAIEHFPLMQALRIVDDIEAYIIYQLKPHYNSQHKSHEKEYHVPFVIRQTRNISLK